MMGLFEWGARLLKGNDEATPREKPGRNDPCWCGSGKKYKKCHLHEDDRKADVQRCNVNCGPT
jgi:hypothetical protein